MQKPFQNMLLISDMDGTLLTADKRVSEENLQAIQKFRSLGGKFTIASGRSIPSLAHFAKKLELDTPVILFNGGAIYDFTNQRTIWHCELPQQSAVTYLKDVMEHFPPVGIEVLVDDKIYVIRNNEIVLKHLNTEKIAYSDVEIDQVPNGWYKVLFGLEPSLMDEFEAYLLGKNYPDVSFVRSFTHYLEMLPLGCSKGGALPHLSELTGVPVDSMVAIGDYYNDYDFIKGAGTGVAVENAPDDIKQIADLVVCDHEHHAISDLVERLIRQF